MTLTELKERKDQKFEMIAVCHDTENILFAVPIPGAFHLHYTTTEPTAGSPAHRSTAYRPYNQGGS